MKQFGLIAVSSVAVALLGATFPVVRAAEPTPGFSSDSALSFDPGTVRFGYADGYWDNDHRWHGWPSAREAREFHRRYHDRIYGYRHTRYPNEGWRDGNSGQRPVPEHVSDRVSDSTKPASSGRTEPHS